jgi:hypothetical protein
MLADSLEIFLNEVAEISNNILKINEETVLCEALRQAEQECRKEFMEIMLQK